MTTNREILLSGSSDTSTVAKIPVGINPETGKDVYASFSVPRRCDTLADVVAALRSLGASSIRISLPRTLHGKGITLQLRALYTGASFAPVFARIAGLELEPASRGRGRGRTAGAATDAGATTDANGTAEPAAVPA